MSGIQITGVTNNATRMLLFTIWGMSLNRAQTAPNSRPTQIAFTNTTARPGMTSSTGSPAKIPKDTATPT